MNNNFFYMDCFEKCGNAMVIDNDGCNVKLVGTVYGSCYGRLSVGNKYDHSWLFNIVNTHGVGGCTGWALGIVNDNKNLSINFWSNPKTTNYAVLLYSGIRASCGKSTKHVFPKWQNGQLFNGDKLKMKLRKLEANNNKFALSFQVLNGINKSKAHDAFIFDFKDDITFHMCVTMYWQNDEIQLLRYMRTNHCDTIASVDKDEKLQAEMTTFKQKLDKEEAQNEKSLKSNFDLMEQLKLNDLEIAKMHKEFNSTPINAKESISKETMKMALGICKLSKLFMDSPLLSPSDAVMSLGELNRFRIQVQAFGVLLLKRENQFESLMVPDVKTYKEWDVKQMIRWISSLDDGRYQKYCDRLKNAFRLDGIKNGGIMVRLARHDLGCQPFNVNSFADREQLEMHFLKLKGCDQ